MFIIVSTVILVPSYSVTKQPTLLYSSYITWINIHGNKVKLAVLPTVLSPFQMVWILTTEDSGKTWANNTAIIPQLFRVTSHSRKKKTNHVIWWHNCQKMKRTGIEPATLRLQLYSRNSQTLNWSRKLYHWATASFSSGGCCGLR